MVPFTVSPFDLDAYLHMNNGRYLTLMDLGRLDLFMRDGLLRLSLKNKWQPIVAAVQVKYSKVLPPFASFRLYTRVLCWEDDTLFVEAECKRKGATVTRAIVKMVVLGPGRRKVPIHDVVSAIGYHGDAPYVPQEVRMWQMPRHE